MTNHRKPVALWAVPRSVSTAFERVFVERGDFEVFHEPFSASYYRSTERRSDRYADEAPKEGCGYAEVMERVMAPSEKPVFIKDMAYHVSGLIGPDLASGFRNTFIIREPKAVLSSLYKKWPDFTFEEAGYEDLHRLFGYAVGCGQEPVVVDASELLENPERIIAAYCEKINVPFVPGALSWEPREVPEWKDWDGWHDEAENSTGIKREPSEKDEELPEGLEEVYARCLPYYEELRAERLRAS